MNMSEAKQDPEEQTKESVLADEAECLLESVECFEECIPPR